MTRTGIRLMIVSLVAATVLASAAWCFAQAKTPPAGPTAAPPPPEAAQVILKAATPGGHDVDAGTIWRYFETFQSDVVKLDSGELLAVDIYNNREKTVAPAPPDPKVAPAAVGKAGAFQIRKANRIYGSPWPAEGWQKPDFDDAAWGRNPGPFPNQYRSLALIALRGKFEVRDPSRVKELALSLRFQGGAVAYLNGQEVGRASLPAGTLKPDTLADDYPEETYVDAKGILIPQPMEYRGPIFGTNATAFWLQRELKDADIISCFQKRARLLEVKIKPELLRKGVNVLAIEIHRSAARPVLYTATSFAPDTYGFNGEVARGWNRCTVEEIQFTAAAASGNPGAGAIVPNYRRPEGFQVWTESVLWAANPIGYGDPCEPIQPIRLRGLRNGVYAGQILVGSDKPIRGLQAVASALKSSKSGNVTSGGGGGGIPASAIEVAFGGVGSIWADKSDERIALDTEPPAEISATPGLRDFWNGPVAYRGRGNEPMGAMQRIWITVKVPRDAAPGTYSCTITVSAQGRPPTAVPLQIKVIGEWTLPDPQQFTMCFGILESAESVAKQYHVPLWSDEHFKHLDKVYELLGQIGAKDIYISAIAKTHLGNEQSMIRFVKQPEGSYLPDFTIAEKYLDIAVKHLGKVPIVGLYIHDYGFRLDYLGLKSHPAVTTAYDPKTGQTSELTPPEWGTPESRKFWAPVVKGFRDLLAKRGLEKSLLFAIGSNNWVNQACLEDLKQLAPDVLWANRTHYTVPSVGDGKSKQTIGFHSVVCGPVAVMWDPEDHQPCYGWTTPELTFSFPRTERGIGAGFMAVLAPYRLCGEGGMLTGLPRPLSAKRPDRSLRSGIGHLGADFWPVVKDPKGGPNKDLCDAFSYWQSLSIAQVPAILGAGVHGPVPSTRQQLMRLGSQEGEVRVYVQNALLDDAKRARLGPDLAQRCKEICDQRTRALHYFSFYSGCVQEMDFAKVFNLELWEQESEKFYELAGEVQKALGK